MGNKILSRVIFVCFSFHVFFVAEAMTKSGARSRHVLCTSCSSSDVRDLRSKNGLAQTSRSKRFWMEKAGQKNNGHGLQRTATYSDEQEIVPKGFLNVLMMPSKGNKRNATRDILGEHFFANAVPVLPPPPPPPRPGNDER